MFHHDSTSERVLSEIDCNRIIYYKQYWVLGMTERTTHGSIGATVLYYFTDRKSKTLFTLI